MRRGPSYLLSTEDRQSGLVMVILSGNLSNSVFEGRTSTGSGLFASLGSGLLKTLG